MGIVLNSPWVQIQTWHCPQVHCLSIIPFGFWRKKWHPLVPFVQEKNEFLLFSPDREMVE